MPRKTKESESIKNEEKNETIFSAILKAGKKSIEKNSDTKKSTGKKSSTKKTSEINEKKDSKTKKTENTVKAKNSASTKKETKSVKADKSTKTTKSANKTTSTSKSRTRKASSVSDKKATNIAKKKSTTVKSTRKITSKKTMSTKKSKKAEVLEYYDLPYRYNQTVVKVLAQTPKNLFIYWDISDDDRENYKKQFGDDFFETTKPVLIVHNDTLNYSFEVEINDFANSWYLHVADSKCDYRIELGRRPIYKTEKLNTDYIYISTSNKIESPNDRILFNKNEKLVYFKNVKTGFVSSKQINNISLIKNMGKIYNIYDIYKAIYENENVEEIYDLSNPGSGNPSSNSFSSKFR